MNPYPATNRYYDALGYLAFFPLALAIIAWLFVLFGGSDAQLFWGPVAAIVFPFSVLMLFGWLVVGAILTQLGHNASARLVDEQHSS